MSKLFPKWDEVDETCPNCHQITKRVRGITKQNVKKLLKPKWDINELVITFIIIMIIIMSFLYMSETKECREFLKEIKTNQEYQEILNTNTINLNNYTIINPNTTTITSNGT